MSDDLEIELHDVPAAEPVVVPADREGLVVVTSAALAAMDAHVAEDTSVEHGGVMVGRVDESTGATVVTGSIRAQGSVSEVASLTFTHETWDHVGAVMEEQFPGAQMVGWYHSHPHFGIFLSDHDLFIHRNFFAQPWQVAYVRDPLLDQRGFFSWVGDQVVEVAEWQVIDPPPGTTESAAEPVVAVTTDGGDRETIPPRTRQPIIEPKPARGGLGKGLFILVALLLVVAGAILGGVLTGGEDDAGPPPPQPVSFDFAPVQGVRIVPGSTTVFATVNPSGGPEGRELRVFAFNAELQGGGAAVEVFEQRDPAGIWELTVIVDPDAPLGRYDGSFSVRACPERGECRGPGVDSARSPYQVEVVEPLASPDEAG